MKSEVAVSWLFTTALERSGCSLARASGPAETTRSQPSSRSASPAGIRTAWIRSWLAAIRTWLTTAPNFCASPVWFKVAQPLPSRWAAMARMELTVRTPVPPMPVTSTFQGRSRSGLSGSDSTISTSPVTSTVGFLSPAPVTVTKLGQNPSRQLKSLLQAFWSICRFSPSSVFFGITDRQLDFVLQSPQPSQTAGLMKTRVSLSGISPPLPAAALFRGAGLVEYDRRGPRHLPDLEEEPVVVLLRVQGDIPDPGEPSLGPRQVLGHHRDALDAPRP